MRYDVFGITKFNKPTSLDVGYITNFMINSLFRQVNYHPIINYEATNIENFRHR